MKKIIVIALVLMLALVGCTQVAPDGGTPSDGGNDTAQPSSESIPFPNPNTGGDAPSELPF